MNKSKLLAIASAVSLTATAVFVANVSAVQMPSLGDIDDNGKIGASDARMILRHVARLEKLDESVFLAADADGDGKITAADARVVLRYASKLTKSMGGEEKYSEIVSSVKASEATLTSVDATAEPTEKPTKITTQRTTVPTTVKPTEPTTVKPTEPTTEKPTETTTEKPTELRTEEESYPFSEEASLEAMQINEKIPKEIGSFLEGKFEGSGMVYSSSGSRTFFTYASDGKQTKLCSYTSEDEKYGLLVMNVKADSGQKSSLLYYLNENNKTYCWLSKGYMKLLGIAEDDLKFEISMPELLYMNFTVSDSQVIKDKKTVCYIFETNGDIVKFHMDGDDLVGVESCDKDGNIKSMYLFDSFSSEVSDSNFSLAGYKKVDFMDIVGDRSEPTSGEDTEPTSVPVTEPTTSHVTEATTTPTSAQDVEPTTAPVSMPDYYEGLPEDIRAFAEGKFSMTGQIVGADSVQDVKMICYEDNVRMGRNNGGNNIDIIKRVKKKITDSGNAEAYYIVNEDNKSYTELTKDVLKIMRLNIDDLNIQAVSVDLSNAMYTTGYTNYNGLKNVLCHIFLTDKSVIKFFMYDDSLIGVEICDLDGTITLNMLFDSFSSDVDESDFSLDSYTKMSLPQFASEM